MTTQPNNTATLVQQAQTGSEKEKRIAFNALTQAYQGMAVNYATKILNDRHLGEDVAQEAFLTAYLKIDQLRQPNAFGTWFKRIIWTHADRAVRGVRPQIESIEQRYDLRTDDPTPEDTVEANEWVDNIHRAVEALPEHERVVTEGFYFQGESQKEIANRLHIPVTTVKKRLQYARQHLRVMIDEFNQVVDQAFDEMFSQPEPKRQRQPVYLYNRRRKDDDPTWDDEN